MHRHKNVTPEVIEANRNNAKKSTGPKTEKGKLAVRHNAVRHGLLAKQILFRNREAERKEFKHLLNSLERDYMPVGLVEEMLVEEIGSCWWKLRTATRWEIKSLRGQSRASARVVNGLHGKPGGDTLLESGWGTDLHQWECETLVIRSGKDDARKSTTTSNRGEILTVVPPITSLKGEDSTLTSGGTEVKATLKSSLPTILRYEASLKRDLYKAIQTLEKLQRRRKEGHRRRDRKKRHRHS